MKTYQVGPKGKKETSILHFCLSKQRKKNQKAHSTAKPGPSNDVDATQAHSGTDQVKAVANGLAQGAAATTPLNPTSLRWLINAM